MCHGIRTPVQGLFGSTTCISHLLPSTAGTGARASDAASTNDAALKASESLLCCTSFTGQARFRAPNLDPFMACKDHVPNTLHLDKLADSCLVSSLFLPLLTLTPICTQPAYMHMLALEIFNEASLANMHEGLKALGKVDTTITATDWRAAAAITPTTTTIAVSNTV